MRMVFGLSHHCLTCGALTRGNPRCLACRPQRGTVYGSRHVAMRKALIAALRRSGGACCPLCSRPLPLSGKGVDLDHVVPVVDGHGAGPVQLVHSSCNSVRGNIRGTTYRLRGEHGW